jgi:hypothetical protein
LEVGGEVLAQTQQKLLRGTHPIASEGEHRILLGVRGDAMTIVSLGVAGPEVAVQLGDDRQILNLVTGRVAGDPNQMVTGFAVLVLAQDDLGVLRRVGRTYN